MVNWKRMVGATDSLLFRIVAGVLAIIAFMSAVLFFGIDLLITTQFARLHEMRVAQYAEEVHRALDREAVGLANLAALISRDTDLNHSAQYHLLLGGEGRALQSDIDRLSDMFQLDSVILTDADGRLLHQLGTAIEPPAASPLGERVETRAEWVGDALWLVAVGSIAYSGEVIARIQIGRPLVPFLHGASLLGSQAHLRLVTAQTASMPGAFRIPVSAVNRSDLALEVAVPGLVEAALTKTKELVAATLLVISLLLAGALVGYLRRQLQPIRELTRLAGTAASTLHHGETQQVSVSGHGEVARLIRAFNGMLRDLAMYSQMEKELRHKEQLSAIGKVATRVAHDINNPLTVIRNTAALMHREAADESGWAEDLALIIHHTRRCQRIVDNLLRFGRPVRLQTEEVEVNAFVRRVLERRMQTRGGRYRFTTGPGQIWVSIDPFQVEQMLDNLLDNAEEANCRDDIDVMVSTVGEDRAAIKIIDHGPGFAPDVRDKAFDLYFTTKAQGTGLGLPNSLSIARAHGGDIVISDPAAGEVTVLLRRGAAAPKGRGLLSPDEGGTGSQPRRP